MDATGLVVPRPPEHRERRPPSPARIVLAGLFVVLLGAAAWHVTRTGTRMPPPDDPPPRPAAVPTVIDGVRVTYTQPENVEHAYRRIAGPDDGIAMRGDPACGRGRSDERAWSRPATPTVVAGRYLCAFEGDRAAMWWTVEDRGLLAHATAGDADVAALFGWWLAHADP